MSCIAICGDVRTNLKELESNFFRCVITSPPYWGLRDYGTAKWEGGNDGCKHIRPTGTILGKRSATFHGSNTQQAHEIKFSHTCAKCGAIRIDNQLGLEPTPEEYVANMVAVFAEVWRVLKDDGTVWLNLGDSYANPGHYKGNPGDGIAGAGHRATEGKYRKDCDGLKNKDLVGIPWRVAFALQTAGWYLRQDIIWAKPNPMPESVTDRCTKSHEYIFLLSKNKSYYFDHEAIKEPTTASTKKRLKQNVTEQIGSDRVPGKTNGNMKAVGNSDTRNRRSVWNISTKPYRGAHFATFPPDLIEPCILAGSKEGDWVLDPFGGSGTTGMVADQHKRNSMLIELNPEYLSLIKKRIPTAEIIE